MGVQNPDPDTAQSYLHVVNLNDSCLVTSGTYQRYYEVDGVRYHHILDPATGRPAQSDIVSIGILCENGAEADFFAMTVREQMPCLPRFLIWIRKPDWGLWKHRKM